VAKYFGRGDLSFWLGKWPLIWPASILIGLAAAAVWLVDEAHDRYVASEPESWGRVYASGLLNGAVVVVLTALVTALVAFIGELRSRTDRAREKRLGLFLRMRGAHVRVALTQQILRAHRDADIYHARMQDLLEVLKDLEELREEVKVSGKLYRSHQRMIMQGIAEIIDYLQKGITQYNAWSDGDDDKSKAPDDGWLGGLVNAPEAPGKVRDPSDESWQPEGNMPSDYDVGLEKSKLVMRAYVYGSRVGADKLVAAGPGPNARLPDGIPNESAESE
jgi:hypothetical protein